jgi:uncharacterized membrane protein
MSSEPNTREAESDRLHGWVQAILRLGMVVSTALMLLGLGIRFAAGLDDAPAVGLWTLFSSGADTGLVITALGVVVLAATPALRAVALVALWWRERDYRFVAVALSVVVTLAASILLGKGG